MSADTLQAALLPSTWRGPGLVDLQVNGYGGFDFNGPAQTWTAEILREIQKKLHQRGVVAALPTLITDDESRMVARARRYAQLLAEAPALEGLYPGLHIEGPFICRDTGPRGAHPEAFCKDPDELPDFVERIWEASGGRIAVMTLAPELPGAIVLVERLANLGVCVALGHTSASAPIIRDAVNAGARMSTHLGNGSHSQLPRLDNYIQNQLAEARLAASFIADGHHIPFATLQNFIRAKTPDRSVLVTDAVAPADAGPGTYSLGEATITADKSLRVTTPGHTGLAGSALTLDLAIINVCRFCGISFEKAWTMASVNAAALIGLSTPAQIEVDIQEQRFFLREGEGHLHTTQKCSHGDSDISDHI
jgi:N-acetylglucosamine-6-phosphate deacetylase